MFSKKQVSFFTVTIALLLFSSNVFAEDSTLSFGVPVYASFNNSWNNTFGGDTVESSSVSGLLVHYKFPGMLGIGMESYKTQIKSPSSLAEDIELSTLLFDLSLLLPVPIVNVTVGAGIGSATLSCQHVLGSCSDLYEDGSFGSSSQLWGQVGLPILPNLDIHASLHRISSTIKGKSGVSDINLDGNMVALGVTIGL
jgi:hypothetical protein